MSCGVGDIVLWWLFVGGLLWLIFAKKERFTGTNPVGDILKVWLFPLWLILSTIELCCKRKKMKWLRKYWLLVAIKKAVDYSFNRNLIGIKRKNIIHKK